MLGSWKLWLGILIVGVLIMWLIWGRRKIPVTQPGSMSPIQRILNGRMVPLRRNHIQSIVNRPPPQSRREVSPRSYKFRSIGEELTCRAFEALIGRRVQYNIRPDFLRNKTGYNLEYDCYDPVSKVAIEYNGRQHSEFVPYFHKTEDKFHAQVERDRTKMRLSEKEGVRLIVVPHTVDTCERDPTKANGYRNIRLDKEDRYARIRSFIERELRRVASETI